MRLDTQSMFSDAQTISSTSTDSSVIDMKSAGIAEAEAYVAVRFDTKAHGCTKVALKACNDNATWKDLVAVDVLDTEAGAGVNIRLPQGCPRYMKIVYTGSSMQGKVTAGVTLQTPSPRGKRIGDFAAN